MLDDSEPRSSAYRTSRNAVWETCVSGSFRFFPLPDPTSAPKTLVDPPARIIAITHFLNHTSWQSSRYLILGGKFLDEEKERERERLTAVPRYAMQVLSSLSGLCDCDCIAVRDNSRVFVLPLIFSNYVRTTLLIIGIVVCPVRSNHLSVFVN